MSSALPQRKRLRHESYDYHKSGAYFVTICIEDGLSLLGQTDQETIILSDAGNMVVEVWDSLPDTFPGIKLDTFVVMPNHIHFIVWLVGSISQQDMVNYNEAHSATTAKNANPSLPDVMQWFKSLTTSKYRRSVHTRNWPAFPGRLWQQSYYEHIVRSDSALYAIRRYIQNNPPRWHVDRYHPNPVGPDIEATALWRMLQSEEGPV